MRRELGAVAAAAGIRRLAMVAWRDLHDVESGGSELHAHEIARRWAAAGIEVVVRTSKVPGLPRRIERDDYVVHRRGGRYAVFWQAPFDLGLGRHGHLDALVEIWNGMPFLSPLWFRGPKICFLHHVHAEMWEMVLPSRRARLGRIFESDIAPLWYRSTPVVTLSKSSRADIVSRLGLREELITVVPPGIDGRFRPGGSRSSTPLVAAVGRLVPVKQLTRLVKAAAALRATHPCFEVVIAGEGYERAALESAILANGMGGIVRLAGHIDDGALVDLYRSAWVVVSASAREGWGMTITEAAACATPSIASRIAGHVDAVEDGRSGLLFGTDDELVSALGAVLSDEVLRRRLGRRALERSRAFSWEAAAAGALDVMAAEVCRHRRSR